MDILNKLEWYFDEPKNARLRDTFKPVSKKQLNTVVFDNSVEDNVKISLPLNEHFLFSETRELKRPATVEQILNLIRKFYDEPLEEENMDKAFENNEEWKEELLDRYDDDISEIKKFDVFVDINCAPDFCGLELNEETGEYCVGIGPE